jgi:hypothetical protein
VGHVADARRIIEDGQLKARLVYDESKLNQTRMHVSWVSANSWHASSIYGTVEFTFAWSDLVNGRQLYWVEAITGYRPPAYRRLLTDRDPASLMHVIPYDPRTADGPLKQRGDSWFWNASFSAKFMIDADITLGLCRRLHFIQHNPQMCGLFGSQCRERSQDPWDSAAFVIGYLIGTGNTTVNRALMFDSGMPNGRPSRMTILGGAGRLLMRLGGINRRFSGPVRAAVSAKLIVQAALLQYAIGDTTEACRLVSLLNSAETLETALRDLVRMHFDLPDFAFD